MPNESDKPLMQIVLHFTALTSEQIGSKHQQEANTFICLRHLDQYCQHFNMGTERARPVGSK